MFQNNLLMAAAANASGGGASVVSIGNSALFAGSGQLSFTPSGTETNGKKYTHSMWISRTHLTNTNSSGYNDNIYSSYTVGGWPSQVNWDVNDCFSASNISSTTYQGNKVTTAKYRDLTAAWYHIFIVFDSTLTVGDDRFQIYINGERVTSFSTDTDPAADSTSSVGKGSVNQLYGLYYNSLRAFYGYISELYFVDGTALDVTDFGEYDSSGLFWTPKDPTAIAASISSYGNNGWYLNFSNGSDLGEDFSGNNNDFSVTSLTQSTHTPTNISALLSPLDKASSLTLSNGNRTFVAGTNQLVHGTIPLPDSGKYYWEVNLDTASSASVGVFLALNGGNEAMTTAASSWGTAVGLYRSNNGNIYVDTTSIFTLSGVSPINTTWQVAVDLDNNKMWFGIDNTWMSSTAATGGNPSTGANPVLTRDFTGYRPLFGNYSNTMTVDFNSASWGYTAPTGFVELNTTNIAAATTRTASDTTKYFDTILYEGNGVGQRVGQFQPFTDSFTIAKSALFNVANEEYFSRTFATPTDQDVWTLSWWMKTGYIGTGIRGIMGGAASNSSLIYVTTANIYIYFNGGAGFVFDIDDPSQWQNIILTCNSGTLTCYWNGVSQGTASVTMGDFNSAVAHTIGSYNGDANWFDGYMADFIFVDGTVHSASVFGQTDTSSGRWVPKDPTTTLDEASDFGNNGFFLNFANSSDMGNDVSGNNHDFTNNNTVTQSTDSPTTNFAVLDAAQTTWGGAVTPSAGNLTAVGTTTTLSNNITSTLTMYSGKYVYAFKPDSVLNLEGQAGIVNDACYIARSNNLQSGVVGTWSAEFSGAVDQFAFNENGTRQSITPNSNYEVGDYIIVALDVDNLLVWVGHYDVSTDTTKWYNTVAGNWTGNPATGTGGSIISGNWFKFSVALYTGRGGVADFGQNSLLSNIDIPTGFNYLTQDNITSSDQFISAFSWIKNRDATDNHMLFDRVRGVYKDIHSNDMVDEVTNLDTVQQFLAGGVQVGNDVEVNTANESYVLWDWMMEATGTGSSNTDGTINTTSTLVDTTLGMSISTYVGTGSNATIGHGLGVKPGLILLKVLNIGGLAEWIVYHKALTTGSALFLNSSVTQAASTGYFNNTQPTSSVFTVGNSTYNNSSGDNHVAYCFSDSQFISIGSYTNNNNANGPFVSTVNSLGIPIQPTWIIAKPLASASWIIFDNKRIGYNVDNNNLLADTTVVENTADKVDIVTGGFKLRTSNDPNYSTSTTVYMAIGTPIIDTSGRIIAGR